MDGRIRFIIVLALGLGLFPALAQIDSTNNAYDPATNQMPVATLTNTYAPIVSAIPTNIYGATPFTPPQAGPGSIASPFLTSPLYGTSAIGAPPGAAAMLVPTGPGIPIYGPIDVHPHPMVTSQYTTAVQSQPGNTHGTFVNTIYAGFLFDLGSHWRLDYTPSYAMYSDRSFENQLSHSVVLTGGTTYEDWTFNLNQTYYTADAPLVETGTQTSQELYNTSLAAVYQMSTHLQWQFGVNQVFRNTDQFDNVKTWTGTTGFNYQFIQQFGMGLLLSGGYNDISAGSSMPFEMIEGTLNFRPGDKLFISLAGGMEEMQFVNPSAPALITPTFSATVDYKLTPTTTINVAGSRTVSPSYFANQVQQSTRVGGAISQQLTKKFSVALNAGYSSEPLSTIVPAPLPPYFIGAPPISYQSQSETEDSFSYGLSLTYIASARLNLSVYCMEENNSSSQANFNYSSTEMGLSLSYFY